MLWLLLTLGCGSPTPEAKPAAPAAPAAPTADVAPSAPNAPADRTALDVGCASELVQHYEALLASGCSLAEVEDSIGLVPRVLRNVPFAARGYAFKSTELQAFFTAASRGCEAPWYRALGTEVTLPDAELACAKTLKVRESELRRERDLPDFIDAYLLANHADQLLDEVARHLGKSDGRDRLIYTHEDGVWTLNFYYEDEMDGDVFESAVVVTCRDGSCESMFAG